MRNDKSGRALVPILLLWLCVPPAVAGRGAAELSLDRSAVRDLLASALPPPLVVDLPGLGPVTLRLRPPRRVEFREGGIDLTLPLELVEAGFSTSLDVRLVPEVEPLLGGIRLRPESVRPAMAIPIDVDLSAWIAAFELPRRLDWAFEVRKDAGLQVDGFLQGMTVLEDRVVLELGLSIRAVHDVRALQRGVD